MSSEALAEMRGAIADLGRTADENFTGVWPINAPIVEAFLVVCTQWRMVAIGGGFAPAVPMFVGLDYASARVALDAEEIVVTPALWRGLRVMETEAVRTLNK